MWRTHLQAPRSDQVPELGISARAVRTALQSWPHESASCLARGSRWPTQEKTNTMKNLAVAALALALLPSCLVVGGNDETVQGNYISQETFAQLQPGESEAFVVSLLGEPSRRVTGKSDGSVLLAWDWSRVVEKKGGVIFLVASSKTTDESNTTWAQFMDGVLIKAWQDDVTR